MPYEMMVANSQHSYANRPLRAITCLGLLRPRRATDGTIQFTPASGLVKHEEDDLAERRAGPPALPGVVQGLRPLLPRVGAVRCAEAALKGGWADRHFPHENSPHTLVTRKSRKGCHLRCGVPLVEQSFCQVEPDHLHVPGGVVDSSS